MTGPSPLKIAFASRHPDELAAYLAGQSQETLVAALADLPADACAGVVAKLPHALSTRLIASESDATVADWVARASLDNALTLVLHLDEARRGNVLRLLSDRRLRRTLERVVVYPRRTVGALMNPTVVRLVASTSLDEAIDLLRVGDETPHEWIWIVDGEGRYVGLLDMSKALLARAERFRVGELAIRLEPLRAETTLAAARDVDEWLKHPELPVVDHLDHLLGTLSRERLMEALKGERPREQGIVDGLTALTNEYFRVMRICLSDLLGGRPGFVRDESRPSRRPRSRESR